MRRPTTRPSRWPVPLGAVLALVVVAGACESSTRVRQRPGETLPPLPPTVTAARITTTTVAVTYVVRRGDTLGVIARRLGVAVRDLAALNGITDPNRIAEGQVLVVPTTTTTTPG